MAGKVRLRELRNDRGEPRLVCADDHACVGNGDHYDTVIGGLIYLVPCVACEVEWLRQQGRDTELAESTGPDLAAGLAERREP